MADLDTLSIQITASCESANKKLGGLINNIKSLSDALGGLNIDNMDKLTNSTQALGDAINAVGKIDKRNISKLGEAVNAIGNNTNLKETVSDMQQVAEGAKKASNALGNVSSTPQMGNMATQMNDKFRLLNSTIENVDYGVSDFQKALLSLRIVLPTEPFEKLHSEIEKQAQAIENLKEKMNMARNNDSDYGNTEQYKKDQAELEKLINDYNRLIQKQKELSTHGGFKINSEGIKKFSDEVSGLVNKVSSVNSRLNSLGKRIADTTKQFKKLSISMGEFGKRLSRIAKMLRLMVERKILQAMIKNVTTGFKNLAQYSTKFDASLSLLWNSFRQLGNAVVSAVSPLINALAPAINYIIQLCIQAVEWINQLLSALTGASTWTKTKQLTDSWADSLDKASGSAGKLNKQLAKFDELNNLTTNNGGGSSLTSPLDMFEDVPVEQKYKDIAQWLKDMWKDANFEELGALLGEKLKEMLDNIPWDKYKAIARKIGRSIATLIKGFIEVEGLGYSIGRTLSEAINTAFEMFNRFVHTLPWDSVGHFIADTLNGVFETLDWDLIKDTFVTGAKGLADAINQFIDDFNWDNVSTTLANAVNTISESIVEFMSTVKFGELGAKLGEQLRKTIENIDWEELGRALGSIIQSAVNFTSRLLKQLDFDTLKKAFSDLINGFKDVVSPKVYKSIKALAKALLSFKVAFAGILGLKKITEFAELLQKAKNLTVVKKAMEGITKTIGIFGDEFAKAFDIYKIGFGNNKVANTFEAIKNSISKCASSASNLTKGLAGIAGVVINFVEFKNFFHDLASGAEISGKQIAKLVGIFGAVEIALGALMGTVGLAIGALGALVGAIVGIGIAVKEEIDASIGQAIYNALAEPNGTPIEDIGGIYSDFFDTLRSEMDDISEGSNNLAIANGDIKTITTNLDKIHVAFDTGAISATEAVEQIKTKLAELAQATIDKIGIVEDTLLKAFGEGGTFANAMETLGMSAEWARGEVTVIAEKLKGVAGDFQKEIDNLKASDPTNPKIKELEQELRDMNTTLEGTGDIATEAKKKLDEALGNIDWSSIVDVETGDIIPENLTSTLDEIISSTEQVQDSVSKAVSATKESLEQLIKTGQLEGLDTSSLETLLSDMDEIEKQVLQDIQDTAQETISTIDASFVQKLPEVIQEAQAQYSNLSYFEKIFISEDKYVKKAVDKYKEGATQIGDAITGTLDDIGIEGESKASQVGEQVIKKLFSWEAVAGTGAREKALTLNQDYVSMLDEFLATVAPKAEETGKAVSDALATSTGEGIKDNELLITNPYARIVADKIPQAIKDSASTIQATSEEVLLTINDSANEVSELTVGTLTKGGTDGGEAFSEGMATSITDNAGLVEGAMSSWSEAFGGALEPLLKTFVETFEAISDEATLSFETFWNEVVDDYWGAKRWTKQLEDIINCFDEVFTLIIETWKTRTSEWWSNDIEPFFNKGKWESILEPIPSAFDSAFAKAYDKVTGWIDRMKDYINSSAQNMGDSLNKLTSSLGDVASEMDKINSKEIKVSVGTQTFATGGFPEDGWFRASHGEMIGQFDNGKSVVANNQQIIQGIANGVAQANQTQNALLAEQNDLLLQILQKETGITHESIFDSVRNSAKTFNKRTGTNALVF